MCFFPHIYFNFMYHTLYSKNLFPFCNFFFFFSKKKEVNCDRYIKFIISVDQFQLICTLLWLVLHIIANWNRFLYNLWPDFRSFQIDSLQWSVILLGFMIFQWSIPKWIDLKRFNRVFLLSFDDHAIALLSWIQIYFQFFRSSMCLLDFRFIIYVLFFLLR